MQTAGGVRFGGIRALPMLLLCVCVAAAAMAATYTSDAVKAAYLFRFASYVEWPGAAGSQAPFVFGVYGAEDVAVHLERLTTGMSVRGRPAEVRRMSRPADVEGVQVLYVGPRVFRGSRALRAATARRQVLLVTDHPDGLAGGGVINFIDARPYVRFEISLKAAERHGLKIDSALLSVATHVEAGEKQ